MMYSYYSYPGWVQQLQRSVRVGSEGKELEDIKQRISLPQQNAACRWIGVTVRWSRLDKKETISPLAYKHSVVFIIRT